MKKNIFLSLIVVCVAIAGIADAKKNPGKKKEYATVVEGYSQRTLPGIRRAVAPAPVIHFIIVWKDKRPPLAFYWTADTGLLQCNVAKASKIVNRSPRMPMGIDYYTARIDLPAIKSGDTLDVTPIPSIAVTADKAEKFPKTTSTLFFDANVSKGNGLRWIHIDTIKKKRDITMP